LIQLFGRTSLSIGNILPKVVLHLVALCKRASQGDALARSEAAELDTALGLKKRSEDFDYFESR
jgi:hypothetical protein